MQRGAGRRAGRFGIAGGKLQAAARDPVEVGRRGADRHAAAIAAEIAPADIVHQVDQDVGLLLARCELACRDLDVGLVHEARLEMIGLAHGRCGDGIECRHASSA